ncbi:hypothetical protein F0U59_08725 [Archangium gephyra]|nr:hypothetical protein F0U59_08725 [Archangium gephyra]
MNVDSRLLVYGQGSLAQQFSEQLASVGALVKSNGSQRPQDYGLVVLDCSTLKPEELSNHAAELRTALEHNRPLLVLQPTTAHKQALAKGKLLRHYIQEPSIALLIEPRRDAQNQLRFSLCEQFPNATGPSVCTAALKQKDGPVQQQPAGEETPSAPPATPVDLSHFMRRLAQDVKTLASGRPLQLDTTSSAPNNPPNNIPSSLYDVTPITLYTTFSPTGSSQGGYTPPTGSFLLEGLVTIGVYYDNTSFNTPVQWVIIDHSGLCDTTLKANDDTHLGWSLGSLDINGQNISSSTMAYKQSSPNNINNATTYTSSSSFTVGLSGGTDGLSGNTSYTIGSSQTSTITDWSIVQNYSDSWTFAQATPYNGNQSGFPDGAVDMGGIETLPAISTTSLSYGTQTVWCRTPAAQQNSSIQYTYKVGAWFIYEDNPGWVWHAYSWHSSPYTVKTFTIDFSAAWPTSQ